jgi:RND superfamily putative drug exporter
MQIIAEFVLRHRRLIFLSWLVVIAAGVFMAGKTTDRMTIDFSLPGQPGTEAANQIDREFHSGGKSWPYIVTVTMPAGKQVTGNEAAIARTFETMPSHLRGPALADVRILHEGNTGDKAFRTKDDRTAYAMLFYRFLQDPTAQLPTDQIRDAAKAGAPTGAAVGVTGYDVLSIGEESTGPGVLAEVLLGGVGALAVLAFVFASLLAFLPLVVAAASILTTFILLYPLTYLTDVSAIVQFLVALIGLGVAIDYSLILVTRWREERDHGRDNHDAVVVAMKTAGKAVVFSGVTVAIGLLALVVLPVPFMRSIGLGGALIPLASVLTTLTLTPAILGGIGPRVDWPKIRHENRASRAWSGWASGVVRHRILATVGALVVLGALVGAFASVKIGLASSDSLAKKGPAYETLQTLKSGGVPTGVLTPIEVITEAPRAPEVATALAQVDGINRAVVSKDEEAVRNNHALVVLIPQKETVNSTALEPVREVKDRAKEIPGVVGIAGAGADQLDFLKAVYGNFPLMLGLISLLTFILLARAFRSLLLPLKAVILNLITVGATLGFMVLFWQYGLGSEQVFNVSETGAITFWVPLMVFAFLYGLSMDYEVFILARVREEYDRTGNTNEAVISGVGRTGRLITSAALILFLSFIALASGPGTDLKTFATALGFGILLDATVVRSLLVPALVSMFDEWNWWMPDWAAKVLRVAPSRPLEPAVAD